MANINQFILDCKSKCWCRGWTADKYDEGVVRSGNKAIRFTKEEEEKTLPYIILELKRGGMHLNCEINIHTVGTFDAIAQEDGTSKVFIKLTSGETVILCEQGILIADAEEGGASQEEEAVEEEATTTESETEAGSEAGTEATEEAAEETATEEEATPQTMAYGLHTLGSRPGPVIR